MSNSKLLIDEQPLQVLPSLACAIGLNEAMVLQQLHWRLRYSKKQVNGLFWVFDKYEVWQQEHFPFWSLDTVKRTFRSLEQKNLVISSDKFNQFKLDRTKWYTINYEVLNTLDTEGENATLNEQKCTMSIANCTDTEGKNATLREGQIAIPNNQKNPQESTTTDKCVSQAKTPATTHSEKSDVLNLLKQYGIEGDLAVDFAKHRKAMKAPITERAMKMLQTQANLAKIPITLAVEIVLAKGTWKSFQADYAWQSTAQALGWRQSFTNNPQNSTAYQRDNHEIQDTTGWSAGLIVDDGRGNVCQF